METPNFTKCGWCGNVLPVFEPDETCESVLGERCQPATEYLEEMMREEEQHNERMKLEYQQWQEEQGWN